VIPAARKQLRHLARACVAAGDYTRLVDYVEAYAERARPRRIPVLDLPMRPDKPSLPGRVLRWFGRAM